MRLRNCSIAALIPAIAIFAANTEKLSDDFYTAIRANDLAKLESMLKQGASANAKDNHDVTPLMYAAAAGSVEAMKLLIDKGADVNARNMFESTALIWSATDIKKIKLLLDHGADVNAVSKQGRTTLLLAALSDHSADIVRLLIAKGANTKVTDKLGMTTLTAAAMGNDTETVKLLIDSNDVNGGAPGMTAALALITDSPLAGAAANGNLAVVKMLLAKGANVNCVSTRDKLFQVKNGNILLGGLTPLLLASAFGPPEVVKALLYAGADVNAKDVRGMTPLMLAVATDRQDPQIIRMLLAKGASVEAKSDLGETALDWARKIGPSSTVDALKRAGAGETVARVIPAGDAAPADLKPAVQRSIALLEKSADGFSKEGGCIGCHAQNMTDLAVGVARSKGLAVDAKAQDERWKLAKSTFGPLAPLLLERMDLAGVPEIVAYSLAGLAATGYAPDSMTDAMVADLAAEQLRDGRWHYGGLARPPFEEGDIFRTALAVRALKVYGSAGRAPEMRQRIDAAKQWLLTAKPLTTEDRNMQLLGLHWAGVEAKALQPMAKAIVAAQRADGGWSQRTELASDAYATGESLYALGEAAGVSRADMAYRKGVKYLLSTQRADGSWYVRSRSPKFQPYFESGFPYGHDQWISASATAWAAMGLTLAIEERPGLRAAK
ncbi:MAG TPA: ankyrin repeat domain-containing protein [Bryobacteraceae bacterium]|nr:ankyrin repeat domain-containing protein [Bryobacteraceae bacterium]